MKMKLYNLNHDFAAPAAADKPIFLPFGTWAYDDKVSQTFDREHAIAIANSLAAAVANGEPGIPVYQGHPDVPALAAKYPDKGALGWIKRIDLANSRGAGASSPADATGVNLTVEWDRFPGKGFAWFSPYWFGEPTGLDNEGKTRVVVDHIASVGLVNNPNISEFRLPNEGEGRALSRPEEQHHSPDGTEAVPPNKGNTMNREELIKMLGLPPEATDDQIKAAIADLMKAGEAKAAAEQKAAEAEKTVATANAEAETAKKDAAAATANCDAAKKELENCKKELETAKTALANEKAEHEKLKALKTRSVTTDLANSRGAGANYRGAGANYRGAGASSPASSPASSDRMALVNEFQQKGMSFDGAWCAAKKQNPELFKD